METLLGSLFQEQVYKLLLLKRLPRKGMETVSLLQSLELDQQLTLLKRLPRKGMETSLPS